jgi:hypothetical protein
MEMNKGRIVVSMLIILMIIILTSTICSANTLYVEDCTAKVNEPFTVNIRCNLTDQIRGFECALLFNETILKATSVNEGGLFNNFDMFESPHFGIINNSAGRIKNIYAVILGPGSASGDKQIIFKVNFTALKEGMSYIGLSGVGIVNDTQYLPVEASNGTVMVSGLYHAPSPPQTVSDEPVKQKDSVMDMTSTIIIILVVGFIITFIFSKFIL